MLQVLLFGKLRRYASVSEPGAPSVLTLEASTAATVGAALAALGVPSADVVHVFVNGRLAEFSRPITDGDRLGVFGMDMALLYV
ncbi:MAG: MoaD/ThiS family protein [Bacteroidetes bacterium]|nr:MoaD/ThiS family protein [Bacteroidota bacterium]MCL5026794.1 MoaD/ThiS family protein [Chloroflexota bacterium]